MCLNYTCVYVPVGWGDGDLEASYHRGDQQLLSSSTLPMLPCQQLPNQVYVHKGSTNTSEYYRCLY